MGIALLKKLNTQVPDPVKMTLAPVIRGTLIYNPTFQNQLSELRKMDAQTYAEIEKSQFKKLKETLVHAYEHTKYYRFLFDNIGFDVNKFHNVNEISRIPVLTKELIKNNFSDLQADDKKDFYAATTGGSTGTPLKVYLDKDSIYREKAFIYHFWERFGYDYKSSKLASFRGADFKGRNFRFNPLYNEIQCNPCNINSDTIREYYQRIRKFGAEFLHGFPSAIYSFCRFAKAAGLDIKDKYKAVFFISENVYDFQREFIEETLGCVSAAFYGHSERAVFAEQLYGSHGGYFFNDYYGFCQISNKGNIICTGFINQKMPLIRYELDDTAVKESDSFLIKGHREGVLYGKNDEFISMAAMEVHSTILEKVVSYQFWQKERGQLDVLVVPIQPLLKQDKCDLQNLFQLKVGNAIDVKIQAVTTPKLTSRGKFKLLIQELE